MGRRCCAYNCGERFHKYSAISFHAFPIDPERRRVWIESLRLENFIPNDHSRICSKHFEEECFDREKFGGRWLKVTAVPTIFDFPLHLQPGEVIRQPLRKRLLCPTEFSSRDQCEELVCKQNESPSELLYYESMHELLDKNRSDNKEPLNECGDISHEENVSFSTAPEVEEPAYVMLSKKTKEEPIDVNIDDRIILLDSTKPPNENEEQNLKSTEKTVSVSQRIIENSVQKSSQNQVKDLQSDLDSEEEDIPSKRRKCFDDTLPLTDQSSILERIEALSKHIETTTCALSILSKAVNNVSDSSAQIVSVVNNLYKSINNIESTLEQFLERKDE